ncbi:MAG: NTP transferase domain-containing protein [Haloarculaceae archaeon]
MCGGDGTRLATDREKPLFPIAGTPMVERVRQALADSKVDRVFAVTSPATPETAATLDCPTLETPGAGYVADLDRALADDRVARPVLTVAADLPLLDGKAVDAVVDAASGSLTVVVPVGRKRALGLSVDTQFRYRGRAVTPAGINVVDSVDDEVWVRRDPGYAVNVNRRADARRAEWWLTGQ